MRGDIETRFKPGMSGNPGGKPQNARNRLTTQLLNALASDFEEHGQAAIIEMRETKPAEYVKVLASLLPKEIEITKPLDEYTDEQLSFVVNAIRATDDALKQAGERASAKTSQKSPKKLPAIS